MLIATFRRNLLSRKGQSIVEIVLITPVVLIALMIPIDFAMMYSVANRTQNAVREVARIAASQSTYNDGAMEADLTARLAGYNVTSSSVTLLKTSPASCTHIVVATANVAYPFFFYRMMKWFGANVGTNQAIVRTAQMRYEFQPATNGGAACTA
jgi:Flp pilus assembly protein TadG